MKLNAYNRKDRLINNAICLIFFLGVLLFFRIKSAIPQNSEYHSFQGDAEEFWGIPHPLNVLSNIPFIIVGLWGFIHTFKKKNQIKVPISELTYFLGVFLTGFGSAYYHQQPNNNTLLWDRIPMTISFMGLIANAIEYRISLKWGRMMLPVLLAFGVFSVMYWHYTEGAGHGDLRPYAIIQFGSLLAYPLIIWRYPNKETSTRNVVYGFTFYLLAKIFEHFDAQIFDYSRIMGGHPLKHLAAGIATFLIGIYILQQKYPTTPPNH